ncbi:FHA domain-containing serine/threonine-protein kinase [Variovorax sp. J31P216]|nr:FHA domain-containing serine/threonine-protein kinase [Variovorax sp. J31P216]
MLCPSCFHDKPDKRVCPNPECRFEESSDRGTQFLPYRHLLRGGRYVVGQVLGKQGGFGVAYKALDVQLHAIVVIKECLLTQSNQVSRDAGSVEVKVNRNFEVDYRRWLGQFHEEANMIRKLKSPYIVRVNEDFEENNTAYYVMPFVEGEDLAKYCLNNGGRLSEEEVLAYAKNLLSALTEMQSKGIVHRDIKPSNVLITRNKRKPVLIDFGAAFDRMNAEQSRSLLAVRARGYSPPEQMRALEEQGSWTDIYALCATLYYCLVSEPPPDAERRCDPENGKQDPFVPIHRRMRHLDSQLATVIDNGLELSPAVRLRDVAKAVRILEGRTIPLDLDLPQTPSPPPPPPPLPLPQPSRRLLSLWAILPSVLLLLYGLFISASFREFIAGWPGLFIAANVVAWALWQANSRPKPAGVPSTPTTTGLGPANIEPEKNTVSGVELRLIWSGRPTVVRSIRPGEKVIVGRTKKSDEVIPNQLLSARHLSIEVTSDGEFNLKDLGSLNHTYIHKRGASGDADSWDQIESARGRKGRFALGPNDAGGVVLEIRQINIKS